MTVLLEAVVTNLLRLIARSPDQFLFWARTEDQLKVSTKPTTILKPEFTQRSWPPRGSILTSYILTYFCKENTENTSYHNMNGFEFQTT